MFVHSLKFRNGFSLLSTFKMALFLVLGLTVFLGLVLEFSDLGLAVALFLVLD